MQQVLKTFISHTNILRATRHVKSDEAPFDACAFGVVPPFGDILGKGTDVQNVSLRRAGIVVWRMRAADSR